MNVKYILVILKLLVGRKLWRGGKWGYCGGSSSLLGQRLYEQQSIEIDARNFAADVLEKYEDKLFA